LESAEEIMEILEAYDLTGSFRDAAELAGCSHHTVANHVEARDAGRPSGWVWLGRS
jgi:molybdenum-dependent DNA-binding transcriptional regulator ModE